MASLAGHISAFLFLFPIGLRRLSAVLSAQLSSPPAGFRSRPWYFSDHPNPQLRFLRNADLHALLFSLPIAIFSETFLFLTLGSLSPHRFHSALEAAVVALFWLFLLLPVALRHSLDLHFSVPDDLVFLLAALAFLAEYALSSSSPASGEVAGVEERASQLSSLLTLACAASSIALALRRSALAADAALSMGLVMKGTWALQSALSLFVLPPRGCRRGAGGGDSRGVMVGGGGWGLECELEEDRRRGVELLDLLFAGHAAAVAGVCVGLHWALARKPSQPAFDAELYMTRPIIAGSAELEMD